MIVSRARRASASLAIAASFAGVSLVGVSLVACERASSRGAAGDSVAAAPIPAPAARSVRDMTPRASAPAPTLADTVDPAATLRAYLARARMHRATRDTLVWEPGADSTSGFRAFRDSTISTFAIG